jgi:ATP-dependent DNA helicase PIF1
MERHLFPLQLAWSITIHRVQGLSMDRGVIDLGRTIFAHGQAYVALSRVRSIEGVVLVGLVKKSLLLTDPKVSREYARLNGAT